MPETAPQRVCLFGGSFDPPHMGHIFAAVWALQTLPVDALWWLPVYEHAFGKELLDWDKRLKLVRAAIGPLHHAMKPCAIEAELGHESRTIDTLRALKKQYPNTTFSLLVGTDLLHEIPRWKESEALQKMVEIYAIGRDSYHDDAASDVVLPNISSTALRDAVQREDRNFYAPRMPRAVCELIEKNGWYKP